MSNSDIRILVVNPNTTKSMTEKIGEAAEAVAPAGVEIVARNPTHGPASIQGEEDGIAALPGLIEEVKNIDIILVKAVKLFSTQSICFVFLHQSKYS